MMIAPVYDATSDLELKQRWLHARDESAFNVLYGRHWPRVERFASRFSTRRLDTEERVSIARYTFARTCGRYDGKTKFFTFMYRCVRNALLDAVRGKKNQL